MARVKRFNADIQVTDQFYRLANLDVDAWVRQKLEDKLTGEATGPRGGRYVLFGDVEHLGKAQLDEDFIRNLWTFRAQRMGRYARPTR